MTQRNETQMRTRRLCCCRFQKVIAHFSDVDCIPFYTAGFRPCGTRSVTVTILPVRELPALNRILKGRNALH